MAVKIGNRLPHGGSSDLPQPNGNSKAAASGLPRRSFTNFLKAIKSHDHRTLDTVYETGYTSSPLAVTKTAMGESSGSAGGYIVPLDYTLKLMEAFAEESFVYPRANVIPMTEAEMQCPKIDVETAQAAGTAPYFGGVLFKWGSEQAPAETEPAFRAESLKAWDLLGYAVIANPMLDDIGPAGENYLLKLFGRAAAWYAEFAFFQGTGTAAKMPLGILNAPATIVQNASAANSIVIADITKMTNKLLPYSWKNAIWATHPSCLAQIQSISQYYINIELMDGKRQGPQCGMLCTRPLFVTDKLPALGTGGNANKGCLVLFDPSLYAIGERQQVLIDVSEHTLFQTQQTVYRIWLRLDGKPVLSNTITLADGSSTASGFIALSS